jgi:hypothetical protein
LGREGRKGNARAVRHVGHDGVAVGDEQARDAGAHVAHGDDAHGGQRVGGRGRHGSGEAGERGGRLGEGFGAGQAFWAIWDREVLLVFCPPAWIVGEYRNWGLNVDCDGSSGFIASLGGPASAASPGRAAASGPPSGPPAIFLAKINSVRGEGLTSAISGRLRCDARGSLAAVGWLVEAVVIALTRSVGGSPVRFRSRGE